MVFPAKKLLCANSGVIQQVEITRPTTKATTPLPKRMDLPPHYYRRGLPRSAVIWRNDKGRLVRMPVWARERAATPHGTAAAPRAQQRVRPGGRTPRPKSAPFRPDN